MYNPKDIQFVGRYDYDRETAEGHAKWGNNFSINIFRWQLKGSGKAMKRSACVVRVKSHSVNKVRAFEIAENIVNALDNGEWDGRKTVQVR